jgi:hypothetical protein
MARQKRKPKRAGNAPHGTTKSAAPHETSAKNSQAIAVEPQLVYAELMTDDEDEQPEHDSNGRSPRAAVPRHTSASGKLLCGATGKRTGRPCQKPAGFGTEHDGEGRCKFHGGSTPIKHGRYSSVRRTRVGEILDELAEDPNPLDLLPEIELLRALVLDYIERHDELTDALLDWHANFREDGSQSGKPRQLPDLLAAAAFLDKIGSMVERVHKQQQTGTISLDVLDRYVEQLGMELVGAAQEAIADDVQRSTLFNGVEQRWQSVRLDLKSRRSWAPAREG